MNNDTFYVYMLANRSNTVLHVGLTDDLTRRTEQLLLTPGEQHEKIVYVERFSHIRMAAARQKTLRSWRWEKKVQLVRSSNREWTDLAHAFRIRDAS